MPAMGMSEAIRAICFAAGSAGIVYLSRASLLRPRSHSFYRFFAWELILGLFLLNVETWFVDPFAPHQLVAWPLLVISLIPLVLGVHALRAHGRLADRRESAPELLAFEKTTALVTTGIYRYVRHPLYSSLLFLAWGIFFKSPGWAGAILALAATACLFATAFADEAECLRFFGPRYLEYMRSTKRFVPLLI
jgi:protein-S-isoprenylcysteine O-methyltransferase Ste14